MAVLTGWRGFVGLAIVALFSVFVASDAIPDLPSTTHYLHDAVLQSATSFDAKCGCNQTVTVTCTPMVLTASIVDTNVPSYQTVQLSQAPPPTTAPTETAAAYDCNGTTMTFAPTMPTATALVPSPTTQTGAGLPGYSVPLYSSLSLTGDTATSSSQTVPEYSLPTVDPSTHTPPSPGIPATWSTWSFSISSYDPATQSNNHSTVHSLTASNTSTYSAYLTSVPAYATVAPPSGTSNSTTRSSTVLSIPTDSTMTVCAGSVSSRPNSTATIASPPCTQNSSTQMISSMRPGHTPIPLTTTASWTWSNSTLTSIIASASESTFVVSAHISPMSTYHNTTLSSTSLTTSNKTSTSSGYGSIDSSWSSKTSEIPLTATVIITHSAHTTSSTLATGTISPTPAPSCHAAPSSAMGIVHESNVTEFAARFCREHFNAGVVFDPTTKPIEDVSHPIDDVVYGYSVSWADAGCPGQLSGQRLPNQKYCEDIYYNNWKSCNNGGWGGATQIGCLLFDFHAYPNVSASSAAPSSTSSSPTWQPTADPSDAGRPNCNPRPPHTNPDAPILPDAVTRIASALCASKTYVAGSMFSRRSAPLVHSRDDHGIHYQFNISWTPDTRDQCVRMPEGQSLPSIGDCKELFVRDYNECNNGGFGGWIEDGCLRFDFTPSLIFASG